MIINEIEQDDLYDLIDGLPEISNKALIVEASSGTGGSPAFRIYGGGGYPDTFQGVVSAFRNRYAVLLVTDGKRVVLEECSSAGDQLMGYSVDQNRIYQYTVSEKDILVTDRAIAAPPVLYTAYLDHGGWNQTDKTQVIKMSAVKGHDYEKIDITPQSADDMKNYSVSGIRAEAKPGALTFIAETIPANDIRVNVSVCSAVYKGMVGGIWTEE